jgi:hypothetical protein
MAARVIVGILALACGSICGLVSGSAYSEMTDKVNERLPKEQQFAELWWYASKYQRLHREYKRLYPEGRLLLRVRVLTVAMFACWLICAWGIGLFAK